MSDHPSGPRRAMRSALGASRRGKTRRQPFAGQPDQPRAPNPWARSVAIVQDADCRRPGSGLSHTPPAADGLPIRAEMNPSAAGNHRATLSCRGDPGRPVVRMNRTRSVPPGISASMASKLPMIFAILSARLMTVSSFWRSRFELVRPNRPRAMVRAALFRSAMTHTSARNTPVRGVAKSGIAAARTARQLCAGSTLEARARRRPRRDLSGVAVLHRTPVPEHAVASLGFNRIETHPSTTWSGRF